MNEKALQEMVLRVVLTELAKTGERFVPVTSSNRHVHLCQGDVERLFGPGYKLTPLRDLLQPGQYACQETVVLEGRKGKATLRVVGPVRKETQVELSYTDCYQLGFDPVLRMSGDTKGSPGGTLVSGDRRVTLDRGILVAKRHLHLSPAEAAAYGLIDGDLVAIQAEGERRALLENLVVRTGPEHSLEAHIDKDEANACGIADGQLCKLVVAGAAKERQPVAAIQPQTSNPLLHTYVPKAPVPQAPVPKAQAAPPQSEPKSKLLDLSGDPHCLLAEADVLSAIRNGFKLIRYRKGAVITPLARDVASEKGIQLIELT
jgi:putative phosphotransacetylase